MNGIKQTREYRTGSNAELKLQRYLIQRGNHVARVAHNGDMAPLLRGYRGALRLPDLQVFMKTGDMVWAEAKWKRTAPYYRNYDMHTTGVDVAAYEDYCEVERLTLHQVYIFFLHEDENEVRFATLDKRRGWFQGTGSGADMMYVNYHGLPTLCTYHELMAVRAMPAKFDTPLFYPDPNGHWVQRRLDLDGSGQDAAE